MNVNDMPLEQILARATLAEAPELLKTASGIRQIVWAAATVLGKPETEVMKMGLGAMAEQTMKFVLHEYDQAVVSRVEDMLTDSAEKGGEPGPVDSHSEQGGSVT